MVRVFEYLWLSKSYLTKNNEMQSNKECFLNIMLMN